MAHTYAIVKSWVDLARPGVHCGYINITMSTDASAVGVHEIAASDVNPNLSTLYQLKVLSGAIGTDNVAQFLMWSYADQTWLVHGADDGLYQDDINVLVGKVLYCYYEGS
jgi:hypothetical protein